MIVTINGFGFLLLSKQEDDRKLREALADVSLAEAEQRQLLSLASHEFRTPAAMIQASLDSLNLLAGSIPPVVAGRLDNIAKAAQRLSHLANTRIAQDRLRELRFSLVRQKTDLNATVARVALDDELLAIALHNLIDNALRHGGGLGLSIVRIIARLHGGEALVRDNTPRDAVFVIRLPVEPDVGAR